MQDIKIDTIELIEKLQALYDQVLKGIDTYTELKEINKDNYMKHSNKGTLTALNVMKKNMQILFKDIIKEN